MEKKKASVSWLAPIALGAMMFSTYVGPGYAAGTQTVSYFLTKGSVGVITGVLATGLLSLIFCLLMMEIYRIYQPKHYREAYNIVFDNKILNFIICNLKDIISVLMVIVSVAAQISGAATILHNLFGLPMIIGQILFVAIILILCLYGAKVINATGTLMTVAILGVTLYIACAVLPQVWGKSMEFVHAGIQPQEYGFSTFNAWYVMLGFCTMFCAGLTPAASTGRGVLVDRKTMIVACLTNIILCVASTMVYTLVFAGAMPEVASEAIPTLYVMQNASDTSRLAQILYAILAIAAMISTGVSLMFSMAARFQGPLGKIWKNSSERARKVVVVVLFLLICTFGSSIGILKLVRYGFGTLTKLTLPVTFLPLLFFVPYRIWRDKKAGMFNKDGFYIKADLSAAYPDGVPEYATVGVKEEN